MNKPKTQCPSPRTLATGEQECRQCGRVWEEDDGAPNCESREVVKQASASDKLKDKYIPPKA